MLDRKVLLIGPMGAGKSTIGEILAKELGWKYFDNDTELCNLNNMSPEELGGLPVDELHTLETSCLENILSRPAPFISGAAASVIDYESNRELIKSVFVVYLRLPLHEIIERAGSTGIGRQFFRAASDGEIRDRFNRRDPLYKDCAKLTVDLSLSADDDAKIILQALTN